MHLLGDKHVGVLHYMNTSLPYVGRRAMEQKVDQMVANLTKRHQEREQSAQQIKRCLEGRRGKHVIIV